MSTAKKSSRLVTLAASITMFAVTGLSLLPGISISVSAATETQTAFSVSSDNPYRSKFGNDYVSRLDAIVLRIFARGKDLSQEKYLAYINAVSNGIKALMAKPAYADSQEIQNIVGYINYELEAVQRRVSRWELFVAELLTVLDATPTGTGNTVPQANLNVQNPQQTSYGQSANASIPDPVAVGRKPNAGWMQIGWTIPKNSTYKYRLYGSLEQTRTYGRSSKITKDVTCAASNTVYERRSEWTVLCSWIDSLADPYTSNEGIEVLNAVGDVVKQIRITTIPFSQKFDWESERDTYLQDSAKADAERAELNRPYNTASWAIIFTKREFTGNLGGLQGANQKCLQQVIEHDWKGKERFQLDSEHVSAYLCSSWRCQNLAPSTSYYTVSLDTGTDSDSKIVTDRYGRIPTTGTSTDGTIGDVSILRSGWNGSMFSSWSGRSGHVTPSEATCNSWTSQERSYNNYQFAAGTAGTAIKMTRNDNGVTLENASASCSTLASIMCVVSPEKTITNMLGSTVTVVNAPAGMSSEDAAKTAEYREFLAWVAADTHNIGFVPYGFISYDSRNPDGNLVKTDGLKDWERRTGKAVRYAYNNAGTVLRIFGINYATYQDRTNRKPIGFNIIEDNRSYFMPASGNYDPLHVGPITSSSPLSNSPSSHYVMEYKGAPVDMDFAKGIKIAVPKYDVSLSGHIADKLYVCYTYDSDTKQARQVQKPDWTTKWFATPVYSTVFDTESSNGIAAGNGSLGSGFCFADYITDFK